MSTKTTKKPSSPSYPDSASDTQRLAKEKLASYGNHYVSEPAGDIATQLKDYAKRKPDVAAMWCFAFGVMIGWKLRG